MKKSLQIHEIFSSINGEINNSHQGSLCTFIRLQGCNLRCCYCDTKKAQKINIPDTEMSITDIFRRVKELKNRNITITGGEPLVQEKNLKHLVDKLIRAGHEVSIETNGSILIPKEFPWIAVYWIIDYKLPYSGVCMDMNNENFMYLEQRDIVKFVVSSYSDFIFAERRAGIIRKDCKENVNDCPTFAFSPCKGKFSAEELFRYMNKSDLLKETGSVLSLQLHKIIGVS